MKHRITVLILLFLLAGISSGCRLFIRLPDEITDPRTREIHRLGAIPEDETWWQTRDRRTREQDKLLFNFPLEQVWKHDFDTGRALVGPPVVRGRQICLTSGPQGLVGLNGEDGIPVWSLAPRPGEECGPLVETEGLLVFATTAGRVVAVEPSEPRVAWETSIPAQGPGPPVAAAGRIYFPTADGELLALSSLDGSLAWRQATGESLAAAPLVDQSEQRLYCGSLAGTMYCFDAASGVVRWRYPAGSPIIATPLLSNRMLFFGDDDGRFHCLRSDDGAPRWVKSAGASIRAQPAVFRKLVIFGSWDGSLYALDQKSGRTRWKAELPNRLEIPPLCIDELVLAACIRSPELTAFQAEDGRSSGAFKLEHLDAWFTATPVISPDHVLYAGTSRGKLLALTELEVEELTEEEASRVRFEELLGSRRNDESAEGSGPGQRAPGTPGGRR